MPSKKNEPPVTESLNLTAQEIPDVTEKPKHKPRATTKRTAKTTDDKQVISYRHNTTRKNNPEVGMVSDANDPAQPKTEWAHNPHLAPELQFDHGRAAVEQLIDDALESGDETVMREALEELKRVQAPFLNWTGKAERTSFEVDTVSLHVHERIDPLSILSALKKRISKGQGSISVWAI